LHAAELVPQQQFLQLLQRPLIGHLWHQIALGFGATEEIQHISGQPHFWRTVRVPQTERAIRPLHAQDTLNRLLDPAAMTKPTGDQG